MSVVKCKDGTLLAHIQKKELTVDPDLIEGFVSAVIIFAKTPIRIIRKASYDIFIEVGENYLIFTICDPVPDESPYRNRMKQVLEFIDGIPFSSAKPSVIRDIASKLQSEGLYWIHNHLLQTLLSSLGMSWMGFLDGNPKEHLEFILQRVENPKARTEIQEYVEMKICEQIDTGGTTIGFDIDKMAEHAHFAKRMSQVLDDRQREIREVEVQVAGDSVDLRGLWLTAYGYRMLLSGLNVGLVCDCQIFGRIQNELNRINITLKTTSSTPCTNFTSVSNEMREYIWEMAIHNSNPISSLVSRLIEGVINLIMR